MVAPPEQKIQRLTSPQARHLREMLSPAGETLYWRPRGSGERRCAETLSRRGLLAGSYVTSTDGYYLSGEGMRVAALLVVEASR